MYQPNIGLYLYKFTVNERRKRSVDFSEIKAPTLSDCIGQFAKIYTQSSKNPVQNQSWYFTEHVDVGDGYRFHLGYGRSGFGSKMVDGRTKMKTYDRKVSDLEVIPLLSRVWLPQSGDYGIWGFQSFGGRSCVGMVISEFKNYFQDRHDGLIFKPVPLVPAHSNAFQTAPVKAVMLKTKTGGDAANSQTGSQATDVVNIDLKLRPEKGEHFGYLKEIMSKFSSKDGAAREFGGHEFSEAYATVDVEGRSRTVTLFGETKGTGLIDMDDTVDKLAGHPKAESFFVEADKVIKMAVKEIGIG